MSGNGNASTSVWWHAELHFKQSPLDKLRFIQTLQQAGQKVIMVGDGLNDAGALRQSDVGLRWSTKCRLFPASDIIISAGVLPDLNGLPVMLGAPWRVVY